MGGEFGVGDLSALTNRLRRAGEDLDDGGRPDAWAGCGPARHPQPDDSEWH